jgi:uncharacterized membrane protein (UPF0182 family)
VIAAYGDRAVMEETLAEALAALFKESAPAAFPLPGPPAARKPRALRTFEHARPSATMTALSRG